MMRIAAIDQGTTSTRAVVLDGNAAPHVAASRRHAQHYPRQGWVEHDPEELLANVTACLAATGALDAVAIANQGESCLAWDARTGRPLSPVIVWQDNRTASALAEARAEMKQLSLARAGLPLDPYFSASKLGWLVENDLDIARAARRGTLRLGTADAFFLDRLCGAFVTDVTTASRTGLMNLETLGWDADLCAAHGVPLEALPEIRPTITTFGAVDGVPVLASMVDQQAALYGHGCRKAGDAKITFGTGAFALAVTGERIVRAPESGILPTLAWSFGAEPPVRAAEGGVYDAGSAVEWARGLGLFADPAELDAFEAPPAISRGIACVPALSGLACPHWDRSAGALWIGMTADTDRRDMCQALLEGIAFLAAQVVAALDTQVPLAATISIDGGLSRSRYFRQMLANATGRTILWREFSELTGVGAALMAARALGAGFAPDLGPATLTRPEPFGPEIMARFEDAVGRARAWREPHG